MLPLHIPENIRISGFEMILGDKYKKVTFGTNGLSKWHETAFLLHFKETATR